MCGGLFLLVKMLIPCVMWLRFNTYVVALQYHPLSAPILRYTSFIWANFTVVILWYINAQCAIEYGFNKCNCNPCHQWIQDKTRCHSRVVLEDWGIFFLYVYIQILEMASNLHLALYWAFTHILNLCHCFIRSCDRLLAEPEYLLIWWEFCFALLHNLIVSFGSVSFLSLLILFLAFANRSHKGEKHQQQVQPNKHSTASSPPTVSMHVCHMRREWRQKTNERKTHWLWSNRPKEQQMASKIHQRPPFYCKIHGQSLFRA
jgi:hypothetical protein